jgi:outer membrane PBP1 activator LpoA protein
MVYPVAFFRFRYTIMGQILRCLKRISLMICVVFLTNCTTITENTPQQRTRQPLTSPYTMPATAYLALAQKQTGEEQQTLLLMASGRFIQDGEWNRAQAILSQMTPLSAEASDEKKILLAKLELLHAKPRNVLTQLASVRNSTTLPIYYQAQYHDLLAQAYQTLGNPTESVVERIKLEAFLPDDLSRANNRRALWLSLTRLPIAELDTLAMEAPSGSTLKGWMQLASLSHKYNHRPHTMLTELQRWQDNYPHHPANSILPESIDDMRARLYPPPKQIALLLPLSGLLSGPGQAIKDGFLAAYEASGMASVTKVRFYDTNIAAVSALYEQALAEGADYIVGPLTKQDVAQVAELPHPVPTLLLNDVQTPLGDNAYQFGLSPTLEARQVAARAHKNGLTRALIIAPEGTWGDEIVKAFINQWGALSGEVVDTLHYQSHGDFNHAIRGILHIDASEAREKQIKQLIGRSIEAIPRRRQDFDLIFLVAYPSEARQIKPLLNYYYAGDVPVYATSSVYGGSPNTMKDRDLNGIIFCDMPWVFMNHLGNRNWPEQLNSYNRLYALGLDSFTLSTQLNQLLLFPAISDESNILYLSNNHQIARILTFGQFRQGEPQLMTED